jgi:coenzyme F420-reducing hydrogenase beta subunit
MADVEERLREEATRLLTEGEVKQVIGYERAGPLKARALFARSPADAKKMHCSPLCGPNLAVYLTMEESRVGEKFGLVVKGCDSRAVVQLIQEGIVDREKVVVLGVPCQGIVDPEKLREVLDKRKVPLPSVKEITIEDGTAKIEAKGGTIQLDKKEIICDVCVGCPHPTPVLYDVLLGGEVKPWGEEGYEAVKEIESMDLQERWDYWKEKFEKCIRCYACREACPLCYCKECLADKTRPTWVRKSVAVPENGFFHLMRAFHLAGRCIGCGACERSCPLGIPLLRLYKKMEKDVKELFAYEAGMDVGQKPLLATFSEEDPEEFIL